MKLKSKVTLREEARSFLRWRRENGGAVEDLRGKRNPDRRQQVNNGIVGAQQSTAEVDVMFEHNRRYGIRGKGYD